MTTGGRPILRPGEGQAVTLTKPPVELAVSQTLDSPRPDRDQIEHKLAEDRRLIEEARRGAARQREAARQGKRALRDARRALRALRG